MPPLIVVFVILEIIVILSIFDEFVKPLSLLSFCDYSVESLCDIRQDLPLIANGTLSKMLTTTRSLLNVRKVSEESLRSNETALSD